jgi:hypothetical protein
MRFSDRWDLVLFGHRVYFSLMIIQNPKPVPDVPFVGREVPPHKPRRPRTLQTFVGRYTWCAKCGKDLVKLPMKYQQAGVCHDHHFDSYSTKRVMVVFRIG